MAILASLPGINLFSSLPSKVPSNDSIHSTTPAPPIPIPKYPPPLKSQNPPPKSSIDPALKAAHRRTNYYKPVKDGVISSEDGRSVIIGESGVSYLLPGAPFEFQFSYSETPKVKPLAIREPAFLPFAPPTMPRPWTGKAPMKKSKKKKIRLFDSLDSTPLDNDGVKRMELARPVALMECGDQRTKEEILGEPLRKVEIRKLVEPYVNNNRQVNLGRDGLTHNMLELVHAHWRRQPICKVRCKGVPTIDMDNICYHLEEKTGGKIIHRVGGIVYLFRGRNYDYNTRPKYPVMLWKPAAPVYPKLIQEAPEGLTKVEADKLRKKGKKLLPICKLAKNGVYHNLVKDVRYAFEGSILVKIDCRGLHATDYKKLGAKLKELVPCVLLSFDDEQVLMWRGENWKSIYGDDEPLSITPVLNAKPTETIDEDNLNPRTNTMCFSPKIMSLWNNAIETSKALLLDQIDLGPDDLLNKVEEFESISQATEQTYPAVILSHDQDHNNYLSDEEDYSDDDDDESYDDLESSIPLGSLPVDHIAEQLNWE